MTIKELENELNIPRATVRFYEKENLITPERGSNGYRDYSDDDIVKLKKIITLRKLGITVNDIKAVFDGEKDLENVVSANIKEIENQMKELTGALNLSKVICEKKENIESFDENFYWNYVADEEEKGNKFIEILDGIAKYEKHLVLNYFGLEDSEGGLNTDRLKAAFKIMAYIIGGGICYMIFYLLDNGEVSFSKFKEGAIVPVVWIIMASVVGLPLYFLGMKYPKVAAGIKKFLFICAGIITALLFGLFIYSRL